MSNRGYVLWTCLAVGCCFIAGGLWAGNLGGIVILLPALAATVFIVQDIRVARQLRREMREWLDG